MISIIWNSSCGNLKILWTDDVRRQQQDSRGESRDQELYIPIHIHTEGTHKHAHANTQSRQPRAALTRFRRSCTRGETHGRALVIAVCNAHFRFLMIMRERGAEERRAVVYRAEGEPMRRSAEWSGWGVKARTWWKSSAANVAKVPLNNKDNNTSRPRLHCAVYVSTQKH